MHINILQVSLLISKEATLRARDIFMMGRSNLSGQEVSENASVYIRDLLEVIRQWYNNVRQKPKIRISCMVIKGLALETHIRWQTIALQR